MKKMSFLLLFAVTVTAMVSAQQVIASTKWTAAFAELAGADDVYALAPATMAHPPEYELRPSDLRRVANAEFVIFAGYENMVARLTETTDNEKTGLIQIRTIHSKPMIRESVLKIATAVGSEAQARENLEELFAYLDDFSADVSRFGLDDAPVLVHFHQRALAEELGMNIVGVFGPAPLEAQQIEELSQAAPVLIIDNGHNPVAQPIAETTEAPRVLWYNFPGIDGTESLQDVFAFNRAALEEAVE